MNGVEYAINWSLIIGLRRRFSRPCQLLEDAHAQTDDINRWPFCLLQPQ